MSASDCPICASETHKVIFMGAPGRLCSNSGCDYVTGLAAHMPPIGGERGFAFMIYESSYLVALCHWLFGREQ